MGKDSLSDSGVYIVVVLLLFRKIAGVLVAHAKWGSRPYMWENLFSVNSMLLQKHQR